MNIETSDLNKLEAKEVCLLAFLAMFFFLLVLTVPLDLSDRISLPYILLIH
jgi:hypothetical protein